MQVLGKFDVSFYPISDKVVVLVTDSKSVNSYNVVYKAIAYIFDDEFGNFERGEDSKHLSSKTLLLNQFKNKDALANTRQSYLFILEKSDFYPEQNYQQDNQTNNSSNNSQDDELIPIKL